VPLKAAPEPTKGAVAIDQGVSSLLTTSDGHKVPVSRALEVRERRLRRYQRSQARKMRAAMARAGLDPSKPIPKGVQLKRSKRFERNRIRIGRLHAKVRDARQELLHQTSRKLVNEHGLIGVETLSIKGMQRGLKRVRGRVANAALGELRRQLDYKAAWADRQVVAIDRFYPSSQLCSKCGWQNKDLKLRDRHWRCAECGADHDRDVNAARNILAEALRIAGLDAGYREEHGKLRTGSVDEAKGSSAASGHGTLNRELNMSPTRANRRRARMDRVKSVAA
jgi:putative transposase